MFKIIAIGVAVMIAAVLIYAATLPDTFRVERTASVKAPPEKIFPLINDLPSWKTWSPYETKDPNMKRTFSGPAGGKGAAYTWDGNNDVGQGRMEIADTAPPSKVTIKLDFIKPFEAHSTAEFTLVPRGDTTDVTWALQGAAPYLARLVCLFFNQDKMVGGDFEIGLANLKALAEK